MKLNTLAKFALVGLVLLGVGAAQAADNQADWTTTLNVKLALLDKLGTDSLRIDVDTMNGSVTLNGTVEKRETLELASSVTKSVGGVKGVSNKLRHENPAPGAVSRAAGEAEAEVKDAVLETKLRLALVDKMGGDGFKIGTEAANGVITLEFDSDFAAARRDQAVAVAKGVEGVTKVVTVNKK
jgi:hyperosmotically inducible protein